MERPVRRGDQRASSYSLSAQGRRDRPWPLISLRRRPLPLRPASPRRPHLARS